MSPGGRVGSDTGGTFTDLVAADGTITKTLSTPGDPGEAVRAGLVSLGARDPDTLTHGTTVATNAVLERRGAQVALVTTEGFSDVIEIGRQDRPSLYDPFADRPEPLVTRALRFGVVERLAADGSVLVPVDLATIPEIPAEVGAVAVVFLHADLNPAHERAVAGVLRSRGLDVTCSHEVAPEFREYERTSTTVMNAYIRPPCRRYLDGLAPVAGEVSVMTSAGGLVPVSEAATSPVRLLVSGPAGGVRAGAAYAVACGRPDAITFDMGGTSTDVCLVLEGRPEPATARDMDGLPVRVPSLDVLTIGAGGGSIARVDPGGALVVGPRSAGAEPGPACYGRGGTEPTVTDANLVAGHLPPGATLGDLEPLDVEAARRALAAAGVDAEGVIAVVEANMARALRRVSVERGVDPRGLALVAFGGAGPLHACGLADALGMETVIVPPRAGVLSAVGILGAPRRHDLVRSWPTPADHTGLADALDALAAEATAAVGGDATVEVGIDCRYAGQSHEITVGAVADFAAEHERRNGYLRGGDAVEVVALRASASVPAPVDIADLPLLERAGGVGPVVIAEPDATIWVPAGWRAQPGPAGCLVLTRH